MGGCPSDQAVIGRSAADSAGRQLEQQTTMLFLGQREPRLGESRGQEGVYDLRRRSMRGEVVG